MDNIRIIVERKDYIIVRADTSRFGINAIMFEGNNFDQVFDYIKRETGKESLQLVGNLASLHTDRCGRTFPAYMVVQ